MTAVEHAELKRLAEGATPGPWNNSGRSVDDFDAECMMRMEWIANGADDDDDDLNANVENDAAFIAAANPAVVLELLSEIEGLKASASVIEPELGDLEASNRDLSRLLAEAERQLAALRTQATDIWRPDREAIKAALGCIRPRMVTGWRGEMVMGLGMEGLDQATDRILSLTITSTTPCSEPQQ